jgi:ssDNA-binding replication factor A large subunit
LRGVEAELDGGLIRGLSEVGQEVTDLFLAGIDDLTGRRLVDDGGHVVTELLEPSADELHQGVR